MKTCIASVFFLIVYSSGICRAQTVEVSSFQHAVRWLSESNFPNYIQEKDAQDSVMSVVQQCLRQQYHAEVIHLPGAIDYRYINGPREMNHFCMILLSQALLNHGHYRILRILFLYVVWKVRLA